MNNQIIYCCNCNVIRNTNQIYGRTEEEAGQRWALIHKRECDILGFSGPV